MVTLLQNDQALPLISSSCVKAAPIVDAGFDSCEKVSTSKLSNVNATLEAFNQPCPIYDVNNVAM